MNFNFYLFDLDGTLLHLGNIGVYADKILVETLKRLNANYPLNRTERFKLWSAEEGYLNVLEEWGVTEPQNFWKFYDEIDFEKRKDLIEKKKIFLYQDVKIVLEKIFHHEENKKLAIVTNTAYYIVDFILQKFNIKQYFQEIFSLGYYIDDQELAKPSPKGVFTILDKFEYDPKESKAILIGDSLFDIVAAKKAGIHACLIRRDIDTRNRRYDKWDFQPDFIIERLDELLYL